MWEWVDWNLNQDGFQGIPNEGCDGSTWTQLPSLKCPQLLDTDYNSSNGTYTISQGMGMLLLGSGVNAMRRSTYYNRRDNAGIYEIFVESDADTTHNLTGLRCVFRY